MQATQDDQSNYISKILLIREAAWSIESALKVWRPEGSSSRPPLLTLGRQPQGRRPSLLLRLGIRRIFSRLPLALILESLGEFVVAFDNA